MNTNCSCGKPAHPLYNGRCEDCWCKPLEMWSIGIGEGYLSGIGKRQKTEEGWSEINYPRRYEGRTK